MATLLASPIFSTLSYSPKRPSDDHVQYRPAKNIDAFNSLLPPAVEFVEGSSSGTFAVPDGKYEPINGSPKAPRAPTEANGKVKTTFLTPQKTPSSQTQVSASLYTRSIDTTWPHGFKAGVGFFNTGNTCFLNSALQCLLHTAPLVRVLLDHSKADQCRVKNNLFCMSCSLRQVMQEAFQRSRPFTPLAITKNVQIIAKQMRKGRQEDSHEFLRYAIDALQKSCLAGHPPKIDHRLAETTWVHKLFGGRLRSRVTCTQCGHNSDTFDSILDLSIDIYGVAGLKEALRKFTATDYLKGADKYKCEKCKKPVNAEKRFTVHEAPVVLTVHLKRFTPMGRKLAHAIKYDERLSLQSAMSDGHFGPTYSLYGVISHAGGGPNSGHYYAHVKSSGGHWYEMNDDSVERVNGSPVGMKNAYILFYIRDKGQSLEAVLNGSSGQRSSVQPNGASKKRKVILSDDENDEDEDRGKNVPFIGPVLPVTSPGQIQSASQRIPNDSLPRSSPVHPQTESLKRKIEAVEQKRQAQAAVKVPLVDYGGDDDEEGEVPERLAATTPFAQSNEPSSSPIHPPTSSLPPSSPPDQSIGSSSFYGTSSKQALNDNTKKRKSPEAGREDKNGSKTPAVLRYTPSADSTPQIRSDKSSLSSSIITNSRNIFSGSASRNPFSGITGSNNFDSKSSEDLMLRPRKLQKQYGKARQRIIM